MTAPVVRIEGLRDLTRDLSKAGGKVSKAMPEANQRVAHDLVVKPARSKASGQPGASGKLAQTGIRAARRARAAVVVIGGTKSSEWALGAEFGSKRYRQFQPFRGNQWEGLPGYVVQPTIRENKPRIEAEYLDTVYDTVRKAAFYQ